MRVFYLFTVSSAPPLSLRARRRQRRRVAIQENNNIYYSLDCFVTLAMTKKIKGTVKKNPPTGGGFWVPPFGLSPIRPRHIGIGKFNTPIQLVRMPGHPDNGGVGVFDARILYGIIESIMQHQKQKPPVNDRWLEVLNYHKGIARFI